MISLYYFIIYFNFLQDMGNFSVDFNVELNDAVADNRILTFNNEIDCVYIDYCIYTEVWKLNVGFSEGQFNNDAINPFL